MTTPIQKTGSSSSQSPMRLNLRCRSKSVKRRFSRSVSRSFYDVVGVTCAIHQLLALPMPVKSAWWLQRDSNPCSESATRFLHEDGHLRALSQLPHPRDQNTPEVSIPR